MVGLGPMSESSRVRFNKLSCGEWSDLENSGLRYNILHQKNSTTKVSWMTLHVLNPSGEALSKVFCK